MRARRRASKESQAQGNLYLLTGLFLGLVLGLGFAWWISPVQYTDTEPRSLSPAYQDEYRRIIALAYAADHNLPRARERLALLSAQSPSQALAGQAQRMKAENQPAEDVRALALLASDLINPPAEVAAVSTNSTQQSTPTEVEGTATPEITPSATLDAAASIQTPTLPLPTHTPVVTRTPQPTFTPRPSVTPMRVLNAPFSVKSKREVCDKTIQPGLIQIQVTDLDGKPLPGVPILITWQGGENTFYTGLVPEINLGYADFVMADKVSYSLRVGEVNKPLNDLSIPACGGGWDIRFEESGSTN